MGEATPGWYPDPRGQGQRYFDGRQWTEHRVPVAGMLPPKRLSSGRTAVIVVSIVGAVIVLGVLGNLGGKAERTAASTASSASSIAPAGSVVSDGKFAFQVKDMRRSGVSGNPDNPYMRVMAQGEFIILTVSVRNVASVPQSYFGQNQKLIDTAGNEYGTTAAADMYANSAMGDVNPGNTIKVLMSFDVPINTVAAELELHDSMISGGTRVAVDDPRAK